MKRIPLMLGVIFLIVGCSPVGQSRQFSESYLQTAVASTAELSKTESSKESKDETETLTGSTRGIQMLLESFVPLVNGYLVIGSMQWSERDYPAYAVDPILDSVKITDASGKGLQFERVFGSEVLQNEKFVSYFAVKTIDTNFLAPLTLSMDRVAVKTYPVSFGFDPGVNPKSDPIWDLNLDVPLAGSIVRVFSARLLVLNVGDLAFQFDVQMDPQVVGNISLSMPINRCTVGSSGYTGERVEIIQVYVPTCREDLPAGSLEVSMDDAMLWGQWKEEWSPR